MEEISKDEYLGFDIVPFDFSSTLTVMCGLHQKLYEGLFLHDTHFED